MILSSASFLSSQMRFKHKGFLMMKMRVSMMGMSFILWSLNASNYILLPSSFNDKELEAFTEVYQLICKLIPRFLTLICKFKMHPEMLRHLANIVSAQYMHIYSPHAIYRWQELSEMHALMTVAAYVMMGSPTYGRQSNSTAYHCKKLKDRNKRLPTSCPGPPFMPDQISCWLQCREKVMQKILQKCCL